MIYQVFKTVTYEYHIDCDDYQEAKAIADSYDEYEESSNAWNAYPSPSFVSPTTRGEINHA